MRADHTIRYPRRAVARATVTNGDEADLCILLGQERETPDRPVLEALLSARCWGTAASRAAAARLLDRHAPWGADLAAGQAFLLAAPSPHQAELFSAVLRSGDGLTLEAIGRRRGLTGRAVSDAVLRAGRRIRAVLQDAPPPWPWLINELGCRLGTVTSEELLQDVLQGLGAAPGSIAALLAAWLAGPFRSVRGCPGWLARDPAALLARSSRCMRADGGVRRYADVADELSELGLVPEMVMRWLKAFGVVVVHDLTVTTTGTLADAIERLLDAYGTARSLAEIAEDLASAGRVVEETSLATAAGGRRFETAKDGRVRLAAWSAPVAERPANRWGHNGAPAHSRRAEHQEVASRPPRAVRDHDGANKAAAKGPLQLLVRVDETVLRGEEATVPVELAEALGLGVGGRRTFSCRWGPLTMAYEGPQPTRGSLRAVARAVGARAGDTLVLGFSPAGELAVDVREALHFEPGVTETAGEAGGPVCESPGVPAMVLRERAGTADSGLAQRQTLFPGLASQGAR